MEKMKKKQQNRIPKKYTLKEMDIVNKTKNNIHILEGITQTKEVLNLLIKSHANALISLFNEKQDLKRENEEDKRRNKKHEKHHKNKLKKLLKELKKLK